MNRFRSLLAAALVVCIAGIGMPLPAQAAMLSTEKALEGGAKARLAALLDREDVQAKLAAYGVSAPEAKARVAALSDDEAAQLASRIGSAPAGGDAAGSLIGAALIVFLVLLITDILGYTHVFPFTKNIKR